MVNPVQGNVAVFPPLQSPLVDVTGSQPSKDSLEVTGQGVMTTPWYLLFRTLFARTGGGTGAPTLVPQSPNDGGTGQSDAPELIPGVAFIAGSGLSNRLAAQTPGQWMVVLNIGPGATSIFPPSGAQINALGVNTSYPLPANTCQIFWWQKNTQIYTMTFA